MATPSNVTAAVLPGNLEFSDGGMAVDWLTGAFVKSISAAGVVTFQAPDGTEASIQLATGGSGNAALWAQAGNNDQVPDSKISSDTPGQNEVLAYQNGARVWAGLAGSLIGARASLPGDAVGQDGSTAVITTDPPALAEKASGTWSIVYTWPAGGAVTQDAVYEQIKEIIQAGTNITLTENDTDDELTIAASGGGGTGDITGVTAGDGLSGGGDSGDVTLNLDIPGMTGTSSVTGTDSFPINDGGQLRRVSAGLFAEFAADYVVDGSTLQYRSDDGEMSVVNPFTNSDESKLDGIESQADRTDQANVYDAAKDAIVAGTGITIDEDDGNDQLTINSTAQGRTLEELQDAVAAMFTHQTAYSYDDNNGQIDTTFPEPEASGIVRVYHQAGLSANRTGSDIVASFDIPQVVIGERVQFYAVFNITTVGTDAGGSVGAHRLSVQQAGVIQSNAEGTFVGQNNLANGVTDTSTGPQYVEGAEYVAFNSISSERLYLHRPSAGANDPGVRYTLSVYMARTKIAQTGEITVRYDDVLDRPIHRVSNEAAIPTPGSSNIGRRYQTNAGLQYVIEREFVAGTDRVVDFEAYPLTSDGYQGAVNNFNDISPGTLTTADEGKWWLIRDYLNQGTAPFVVIDSNASPQNIAHIPDAGYNWKQRYHSEAEAESDASIVATDAFVYPNANGLDTLYRPSSSFVPGTPAHDVYVIVPVDLPPNMVQSVNDLVTANAQRGPDIEVHSTQASYNAAADDDDKIHLLAISS